MPETQTVKVTVYRFEELNEKSKEKVLNEIGEWNGKAFEFDYILDNFNSDVAEKKGVKFNKIYFDSYPWSHTDGEASITDVKKLLQAVNVDLRTKAAREIIENGVIVKTRYVSHSWNPFSVDCGYSTDDNTLKQIHEIEIKIDDLLNSLADDYVKNVRDAYEYETGEEYVKETIAANDYRFLEDGTIWYGKI